MAPEGTAIPLHVNDLGLGKFLFVDGSAVQHSRNPSVGPAVLLITWTGHLTNLTFANRDLARLHLCKVHFLEAPPKICQRSR